MHRFVLSCILLLGCASATNAQELLTVSGKVVAFEDDAPLPGVNVMVKGTSQGTSTNAQGRYSLDVRSTDVLVFSFIGYTTAEVDVGRRTVIDIRLEADVTTLREVTIMSTGYQELPRERVTGSFTHVDQDLFNRTVGTDFISRLENVTNGLVFNRNGEGRSIDISIRGMSTINSNTQPLIVVDNFPFDGDFNSINPNDVESITVLKDAAAASIWGARAGNGVIVVTTKRGGKNTPMKVTFNANVLMTEVPDLFYTPRMSSSDFIAIERQLFENGFYAQTETSPNRLPLTPAVELMIAERDGVIDRDEMDRELERLVQYDIRDDFERYFYRTGVNQQYALNLQGGSAAHRYFFSAGWDRNAESLVHNGYDRITLSARNAWSGLNDKLNIAVGVYYTGSTRMNNNPGHSSIFFGTTGALYPYARLKDETGNNVAIAKDYRLSLSEEAEQDGLLDWRYVPLDEIRYTSNVTRATDYRINTSTSYQLAPGLRGEVLYQYWRSVSEQRDLRDGRTYHTRDLINRFSQVDINGNVVRPVPLGGILDLRHGTMASHNGRTQLNYDRSWNGHDVAAMAGYEVRELTAEAVVSRFYGYDDEVATSQIVDYIGIYPMYHNPAAAGRILSGQGISSVTDRFISYYLNGSYTFRKRYQLTVSARKDQSNLFGVRTNQRGVPLWSVGMGWNAHEESFFSSDAFPMLRLRATYGYNGNINKSVTAYTTARASGTDNLNRLPFGTITNPPNPDLRWERVKMFNVGLDFEVGNRILWGTIEYYTKRGLDLIGTMPFPPSTGITSFTGNNAGTKGRGLDVILRSTNVDRGWQWNTTYILNGLWEKVTSYEVASTASDHLRYGSGSLGVIAPFEGKPLYALYSYPWAGLDPATGDPRSLLGGEPSSDYNAIVTQATPESIRYHGPARPTVFGSMINTFCWRDLSISFNLTYRLGHFFRRNSVRYASILTGNVGHGDYNQRWQQPGDEAHTDVPSMPPGPNVNRDDVYIYSEALVEKGDHVRLQDIRLSYTLKPGGSPFAQVQFYATLNNLGVIAKATRVDFDPDFPLQKPLRTIAAGVKVDF